MRHRVPLSQDNKLCASPLFPDRKKTDTFSYERSLIRSGYQYVAGLDEAGRGPLAGPVVAGCVVLPVDCEYKLFRDSKELPAERREELFEILHSCGAKFGCGIVSPRDIDRINILQASLKAMELAYADLVRQYSIQPDFLLIDGTFPAPVNLPQKTLTKGESKSASIAAASIIAKVMRDRLMVEYHSRYPAYNFSRNKGYATAEHRRAIKENGPCGIHRFTFRGVKEYAEIESLEEQTHDQKSLW